MQCLAARLFYQTTRRCMVRHAHCDAVHSQFTMPVEVDWSKNDTSLMGRFWAAHPGEQAEAAEISDRILVFHRGVDTVTLVLQTCALMPVLGASWVHQHKNLWAVRLLVAQHATRSELPRETQRVIC
jgi:hypothetical protein